jgi:putative transposase
LPLSSKIISTRAPTDVRKRRWIAQNVERKLRNFLGPKFWARGYFGSTVARDAETIRAYIRNQEMADKQLDRMQFKLAFS